MALKTVRLFVSSPGDVEHERQRVARVAERLNGEFAGVARIEALRWETSFYGAHAGFQPQITEAADCDIVIAIFWARLGSELPPDFPRMENGEPYPSGTAYEVLSAIRARQAKSFPDIYVFRKTERPRFAIDNPEELDLARSQWERLKNFFERWFVDPQGHFRAAFHSFDSTDDFEGKAEALLREWLERNVLHGRSVVWPTAIKGSPFCGLAPFEVGHAAVFFGRTRDTARAIERLKVAAERKRPFLLVVGASGSGKSSLVRAGLVPRLIAPGVVPVVDLWRVVVMRPGSKPIEALAEALFAHVMHPDGSGVALPELAEGDSKTPVELTPLLRNGDETSARPLLRALDRVGSAAQQRGGFERPVRANLLLVVDQLDDLFATDVPAADRAAFARLLYALVASERIWVVTTLRAALYEPFLNVGNLKALKDAGADYDLAPPAEAELAEIVRKPAEAAALVYERDVSGITLDEKLLGDAAGADTLPLLQFTLQRLYEAREVVGGEIRLTHAAYLALGGIDGAIDQAGERALAGLGESEIGALARLLRALAVPVQDAVSATSSRTALTIRAAGLAEAAPDAASRRLVDALVEARILLATEESGVPTIRLAHQRVLESWARARAIVASNADFFRIRREVEDQRRRWEANGRKAELLLASGVSLAEAESLVTSFGTELRAELRTFIAASGRRARMRQRLIAAAAAVFALLACGASVLGYIAYRARQHAEAETVRAERQTAEAIARQAEAEQERNRAQITRSRFLADVARQKQAAGDSVTAALLALEGLPDPTKGSPRLDVREARTALFLALPEIHESLVFGEKGPSSLMVLSRDGSKVAWVTKGEGGPKSQQDASDGAEDVVVAQVATGKVVARLTGHSRSINSLRFSPDSQRLLTASNDATVRVWSLTTGTAVTVLKTDAIEVASAEFSDGGASVSASLKNLTGQAWDIATGRSFGVVGTPGEIARHQGSGILSDDGRFMAVKLGRQSVHLWDFSQRRLLAELAIPDGEFLAITYHNQNSVILTALGDRRGATSPPFRTHLRLWDGSGRMIADLGDRTQRLRSYVVREDTGQIITALDDRTLRIWDLVSGGSLRELRLSSAAEDIELSPDGRFAIARIEEAIQVIELESGAVLRTISVKGLSDNFVSPVGRSLITVSNPDRRTLRFWDWEMGVEIGVLTATAQFSRVQYSPDGRHVFASSVDGMTRAWRWNGDRHPLHVEGREEASITRLAADGRSIFGAAYSLEVINRQYRLSSRMRLWNVDRTEMIFDLGGPGLSASQIAFSGDNSKVVMRLADGSIQVRNALDGNLISLLPRHDGFTRITVNELGDRAFIEYGRTDGPNTHVLWDLNEPRQIAVFSQRVAKAAFNERPRRLLLVSERTDNPMSVLVDSDTGRRVAELPAFDLTFSADQRLVVKTGRNPGNTDYALVRMWKAETGEPVQLPRQADEIIDAVYHDPSGPRMATVLRDNRVLVWHKESEQFLTEIAGHSDYIDSVAFSKRNVILTTSFDKKARLWSGDTGQKLFEIQGHDWSSNPIKLSPDGSYVFQSSYGSVRIWNVEGVQQVNMSADVRALHELQFFDEERKLFLPLQHGVRIYSLYDNFESLIAGGKAAVRRCLTAEQRREVFLEATPPDWCIEMEKWPYHTPDWKKWLIDVRTGKNPPLPSPP